MPVRQILTIGHPTLRQVASAIPLGDIPNVETQALIDDLIDTMRDANGAGLAANQIGVAKRIVVMEVNDNPRYPYKPRIPLTVAINPELVPLDNEMVSINEGCLSVPLRGFVDRHINLAVSYYDREGVNHKMTVRGLTAGTWQHECDHLDGMLIVDRADSKTLATWDQYEQHYRDDFVHRITDFVAKVGS